MALSLKVKVSTPTGEVTRVMRFMGDMSVNEMVAEIRDKTGHGGADHGVFQPAQAGAEKPRWLRPEKTLRFYDLQSGMEVEYKKKHRRLRIKLLDETTKVVLVDDSQSITEVTAVICERMDIKNPEEFSLKLENTSSWLNPNLSLSEQGVDDNTVVVLKKKFFFNDANVDKSDPIQLHLLYVQMRSSIVSGDHPVSQEEARDLAALQLQVAQGDFNPNKHTKPGYVEWEQFLPPAFSKVKNIDKEVFGEYRKLVGMTDENAKYRYVQLCRSLKTYGITFFPVKEMIKKKPTPRLLGITRSNIMRLDPVTREVLVDHDISHLKRWSATPTSFMMDFGEYESDYVKCQTPDAEAISQIVAGYIDIILKVRKDAGITIDEDDGDEAAIETVAPITGMAYSTASTSITTGNYDPSMGGYGQMGGAGQMAGMMGTGGAHGVLLTPQDLLGALTATNGLLGHWGGPGGDAKGLGLDQWRDNLMQNMGALTAAATALMNGAVAGEDLDPLAKDLFDALKNVIGAARVAAALAGDDISLLDGAKAVSEAVAKVLQASADLAKNPNDPRAQEALRAAKMALQAASTYLSAAANSRLADLPSQSLLAEAAKLVAASVTQLVGDASRVAKDRNSPEVMDAAREAGAQAAQLVVTASAVAPAIVDKDVRAQVDACCSALEAADATLLAALAASGADAETMRNMREAAKAVSDAIRQLMDASLCAGMMGSEPQDFVTPVVVISSNAAKIESDARSSPTVIEPSTKKIAEAANQLMQSAKVTAKTADPARQKELLNAAKNLLANMQKLNESSKKAVANPKDTYTMQQLETNAETIDSAARELLSAAGMDAIMDSVRYWSKVAAASTASLIAAANSSALRTSDVETKTQLLGNARTAGHGLSHMITALKESTLNPHDAERSQQLVVACKQEAHPAAKLVAVSKGALPKIEDFNKKTQLNQAADEVSTALQQLMAAVKAASDKGPGKEVAEALSQLTFVAADLDATMFAAETGSLPRLPGQNIDSALELLVAALRHLQSTVQPLRNAALEGEKGPNLGPASKDTAGALYSCAVESKAVAACAANAKMQVKIVSASKGLVDAGQVCIERAVGLSQMPDNEPLRQDMDASVSGLNDAIVRLLNAARGLDTRELDDAVERMRSSAESMRYAPGSAGGTARDRSDRFVRAAKDLIEAATSYKTSLEKVATSAESDPKNLGPAVKMSVNTLAPFVSKANEAAAQCPDEAIGSAVSAAARDMASNGSNVVGYAKIQATTQDVASRQNMSTAQRGVTEAFERLLDALGSAQPGQVEVQRAVDALRRAMREMNLGGTTSGSRSLQELTAACRALGEVTSAMTREARSNPEGLGANALKAADQAAIAAAASRTAAAAAGFSDGSRSSRVSGVSEPLQNILKEVEALEKGGLGDAQAECDASKRVAVEATRVVARVKDAAQRMDDVEAKRAVIFATEALGKATATMARQSRTGLRKQDLIALETAVNDLNGAVTLAGGKGEPAGELMYASRMLLDATGNLIGASSGVVGNPTDGRRQAALTTAAQSMPQAIENILNAASAMTPGVRECDAAIAAAEAVIGDIDAAAIAVTFGALEPPSKQGVTHQDCQRELVGVCKDLTAAVSDLSSGDSSRLAGAADASRKSAQAFGEHLVAAAATTSNRKVQDDLLGNGKALGEALLELLVAAKAQAAGTGAKGGKGLKECGQAATKAIAELAASLRSGVVSLKELDDAIRKIGEQSQKFGQPGRADTGVTYGSAQQQLKENCQALVQDLSTLVSSAKTNVDELGTSAKVLSDKLEKVVDSTRAAAATTTDTKAQQALLAGGKSTVSATQELVTRARDVANKPQDRALQKQLQDSYTGVSKAVTALLDASYAGATGERDCDEASTALGRVLVDLDSASLFAAAGQIDAASLAPGKTFQQCSDELIKHAKAMSAAAGKFDTSGGNQAEVGKTAKTLAGAGAELAKYTKATGALGGDKTLQQNMLDACKEAVRSAQNLTNVGKQALGNAQDETVQQVVRQSGKDVQSAVVELTGLAERAANELARGIVELDRAKEAVGATLLQYPQKTFVGNANANAETLVQQARALAAATGDLVAGCGSSQDELIEGARKTAKSATALLEAAKGAGKTTNEAAVRGKVDEAAQETVRAAVDLLEKSKAASTTQSLAAQAELSAAARKCADGLQEVVSSANRLPGGEGLSLVEDTGNDAESNAERELLACAQIIEDAARSIHSADQIKGIDDALKECVATILAAAQGIGVASTQLAKAAHGAQKERVARGQDVRTKHIGLWRPDPRWAFGLVSAAKEVTAAVKNLVNYANAAAQGKADEEQLIVSARTLSASVALLVSACAAKAETNSKSLAQINAAAKQVAKASSLLVDAARKSSQQSSASNAGDYEMSVSQKDQFEVQVRIAKLEKELEQERLKLARMRKAQYGGK